MVFGWLAILYGLSWWQAVSAILVGTFVGSVAVMSLSLLGFRSATNNSVTSGAYFGVRGRLVASVIGLLLCLGYIALTVWTGGEALVISLGRMTGVRGDGRLARPRVRPHRRRGGRRRRLRIPVAGGAQQAHRPGRRRDHGAVGDRLRARLRRLVSGRPGALRPRRVLADLAAGGPDGRHRRTRLVRDPDRRLDALRVARAALGAFGDRRDLARALRRPERPDPLRRLRLRRRLRRVQLRRRLRLRRAGLAGRSDPGHRRDRQPRAGRHQPLQHGARPRRDPAAAHPHCRRPSPSRRSPSPWCSSASSCGTPSRR